MKTYAYIKTYTHILMAALFIIAMNWKQSIWLSTDEWINGMWHNYAMEYSAKMKWSIDTSYNLGEPVKRKNPVLKDCKLYYLYY